jgi:hypothetical protein
MPGSLHGSRRKRAATAAALFGVGIVEHKARMDQRIFPVQRHARQVQHAFGIDIDVDVFVVEYVVSRARFGIKLELVTQAGTAAAEHAQSQTAADALLLEGSPNLFNCFGCYGDHNGFPLGECNIAPAASAISLKLIVSGVVDDHAIDCRHGITLGGGHAGQQESASGAGERQYSIGCG